MITIEPWLRFTKKSYNIETTRCCIVKLTTTRTDNLYKMCIRISAGLFVLFATLVGFSDALPAPPAAAGYAPAHADHKVPAFAANVFGPPQSLHLHIIPPKQVAAAYAPAPAAYAAPASAAYAAPASAAYSAPASAAYAAPASAAYTAQASAAYAAPASAAYAAPATAAYAAPAPAAIPAAYAAPPAPARSAYASPPYTAQFTAYNSLAKDH